MPGAPLGLREPPHLDRGDLLEIEQSGRGIAAMAGNDDAVVVDQNRNDKSECGDAVGNLTDLLARMGARVTTVRRELVDRSPADINHEFLNGRQGERVRADPVTDQFVWGAQARIISTQVASRFCWCSLPSDGAVCGPRHRRGYLSDGHRPQAWM